MADALSDQGYMHTKKILILGEYGNFGRRISTAIAGMPGVECVLGAPHTWRGHRLARQLGVRFQQIDVHNRPVLRQSIEGVFAIINTCGPFQTRDYIVAEQCADRGIHYIDPADSRDYVKGMARLGRRAEKSGSLIVTGASAAPAVSTMLVDAVAGQFDQIDEIHTSLTPGSKDQRYLATLRAILGYHGNAARMYSRAESRQWAKPMAISFPSPVGRRRAYICEVPDIDIFPSRYGVKKVTFRTGIPSITINLSLSLLSGLRKRGQAISIPPSVEFLIRRAKFFHGFGSVNSGLSVTVRGRSSGQLISRTVSLVARDENGSAIQTAAPIALLKKWVSQGIPAAGFSPCVGLLSLADIKAELIDYDIVMVQS